MAPDASQFEIHWTLIKAFLSTPDYMMAMYNMARTMLEVKILLYFAKFKLMYQFFAE